MQRWSLVVLILGGLTVLMVGQSRGREWRIDGTLIRDSGVVRSLDLNAEDMERLIYGVDEIPGYECRPNPYNGIHTLIGLNSNGDKLSGWLRSHIVRGWTNVSTVKLLRVEVRVYDKPASEYETYENYRWGTQVLPVKGSFSGLPLGEECFRYGKKQIWFRLGRCVAEIALLVRREEELADGLYIEALAWGIAYRVQQHPKRLGMAQRAMTVLVAQRPVAQGAAMSLAGVTVAPVSLLKEAGTETTVNRTREE